MAKIILLGYMGSGKTTIAQKISEKLYKKALDLDSLIEEELQMSVNKIFETKGELFFRKKEHEILNKLMASNEDFILSLGGGTPCYANNHLYLKNSDVQSFYLKTSIKSIVDRLKDHKADRPLLNNLIDNELYEFIAKHLFERSYYYHQANFVVDTDEKTIQEIVNDILILLA